MEREMRKTFIGPHQLFSALGTSSMETYMAINSHKTNVTRYNDDTSAALVDRNVIQFNEAENQTFAEYLSVKALADVIDISQTPLSDPRTLLIVSTTKGDVEYLNTESDKCFLWDLSNRIADKLNCHNEPLIISNACISGVAAIITGSRLIEKGDYDHAYVLGIDVVSEFVTSGFNSFKSISPTVCRPFDVTRDGLTLGEACAVIMLTQDVALSETKIVVSGGAMSDDANHISGPSRTGDGLHLAISKAMYQAGVTAGDIHLINAHGTGTPFNDEMESKAFNLASLTHVPCNSLKPCLGHTLGASGVAETILTIMQAQHNEVFGTEGYSVNGVPHELNISNKKRHVAIYHCLKTASGFGGTNAAIVLSKETHLKKRISTIDNHNIEAIGSVSIVPEAGTTFGTHIRQLYKSLGESNLKFFKMDNLSKLAYTASCILLKDVVLSTPSDRVGIVVANRSSSLDTDINHQTNINLRQVEGTSPSVFVYTLANVMAAEIAISHKIQGELSVFISEKKNMSFLENYSTDLINRNLCDMVIYGWCELLKEDYNAEFKLIKKNNNGTD